MFLAIPYAKAVVNFLFFNHVETKNASASGLPIFDGLIITPSLCGQQLPEIQQFPPSHDIFFQSIHTDTSSEFFWAGCRAAISAAFLISFRSCVLSQG